MSLRPTHCLTTVGLALAALLAAAALANAGTYEVRACDAAAGVNHSWTTAVNESHLAAYTACPSGGNPAGGLVARTAVAARGTAVGQASSATVAFAAPAGTRITALRASYRFYRGNYSNWEAGLSNGTQFLAGCPGFGAPCTVTGNEQTIGIPGSELVYIGVYCTVGPCPVDSSGNATGGYEQASAHLYSATVTLQDDSPPTIQGLAGDLLSGGWKRAGQPLTLGASDNSGISQTRVLIDGRAVLSAGKACDDTYAIPCPQGGGAFTIDTTAAQQDGAHAITAQAIDAAGNVAQETRQVLIDNTPPAPPEQLRLDDGDGWHATNAFAARWTNPDEPGTAPIAGAQWKLCPAVGTAPCRSGNVDGAGLTSADGIQAPADGDYLLRLWLRDAAGNADVRTAGDPVHVRFDDQAPHAAFAAPDPTDPTTIAVDVTDNASGLSGGVVEVRRTGADAWRPLTTRVSGERLLASVDDEHLANGVYEVRARAVDQAGNERSTTTRADGRAMQLTLPIRLATRIRAGAIRVVHRRGHASATIRRRVRVPFGHRTRLRGRLTSRDGTPVAQTEVQVLQLRHQAGASWTPVATLKTSDRGGFTYLAPAGVSRTVRFRYPGTAVVRPADSDVRLRVAALSTIALPRHQYVNGSVAHFRGHVLGGNIPAGGKIVELQVLLRGRFRTFATTRANRHGRWRYDYRFDGTSGRQTYRFRAHIPTEATYPYDPGASHRVIVVVRGV